MENGNRKSIEDLESTSVTKIKNASTDPMEANGT
jgi:hypothetical protein